ncbi:hypothetical protein C2R22_21080 (plasmid) [Salinigranum rubrum]|uniref:Uncharacterized protein n=1 Tax=Salinigranum rubrum TaxID=755307 RepID=A0A2I8VQQ8_9EURY|nr:hypothetical protein [Salinigranum rubrum]AUV84262.1 hypothetical protein C2R22_21080 [Salinigranum rubrum]
MLPVGNAKATGVQGFGAIVAFLGTLWLVQGLGLVEIEPLLCVGDCEPITGGSMRWTAIGTVAILGGIGTVWKGHRLSRSESRHVKP